MDKNNFKNTAIDVVKKPFVVVLAIVVLGVCVLMAFTLSKAVNSKIAAFEEAKTTDIAETTEEKTTEPTGNIVVSTIKKYSEYIENIYVTKEASRIAVTVEFKDETALLEEHYAANAFSVDVAPVFCFYIDNGTQIKLPGELRLLSDGKSVVYYLSRIDDIKNAIAQTEDITLTLENIMTNDFNIYLQHKTRDGVGKTLLGTYGKTAEQFKASYMQKLPKTVDVNKDIKLVEVTAVDEFVWLDVYFENEEAYNKYAGDSAQSFMSLGFEHGGKLYKESFIVSEYKSMNMLRLKFDDYALSPLLKEMGEKKLTVKELFEGYNIEVWATDYKTNTTLFCINNTAEIISQLSKSTTIDN